MSNRAPRARPCGPRAGLLLPKLPHSRTVPSSSTGVADSQRVNGGRSRSSAAAPRGAGQLWAETAAPHPRGGPRSRSHSQTNSTRETFRSQSAADSAPCSSPARRDTVPAPPSQTPAPHTHPVRGALPPLGPGSRPRTRPPAPRAPPPARACAPWPRWRGGRRAPTGLMLRPGIVGRLEALRLGKLGPDQVEPGQRVGGAATQPLTHLRHGRACAREAAAARVPGCGAARLLAEQLGGGVGRGRGRRVVGVLGRSGGLQPVCPARTSANQLIPVWMLSHQRECPQVRGMEQK